MLIPIRKMGNSFAVIIPKAVLMQIGVEAGDDLDLSVDEGRILLDPVKRQSHAGWAEASKRIAQVNDDMLVWPEFSNDDDGDLKW